MDERPTPTVFGALWAYRWLSLAIVIAAVALSVGFGLATRPEVTATATMVLATPTANDQVGVPALTEATYVRYVQQRALFVTSNEVLSAAASKLGGGSVQSLRDHVSATSGSGGRAVLVTASATSAAEAVKIANAVVAAYRTASTNQVLARAQTVLRAIRKTQAAIVTRLGVKTAAADPNYQSLTQQDSSITVATARFGSGITFVDTATSASAVRPGPPYLDAAVGLAVGILLAAAIAWVLADRKGNNVRADDDIESIVEAPSIGEIARSRSLKRRGNGLDVASLPTRQFQVAWAAAQGRASTGVVLVAGPESGEGRTTVALHMAASAARDGYRVLLVDGDRHASALTRMWGLENLRAGLDALVAQQVSLDDVLHQIDLGNGSVLSVLACGEVTPLPSGTHRMDAVAVAFASMRQGFDVVFIDSAAAVDSLEDAALATNADHVLIVVREDGDRDALRRFVQRLTLFNARPAGHIRNFAQSSRSHGGGGRREPDRPVGLTQLVGPQGR